VIVIRAAQKSIIGLVGLLFQEGVLLHDLAWSDFPWYDCAVMSRDAEIRAGLERQWAELELGTELQWEDDLIWCPSQCYAPITYQGVHYVLYLRWRWDDPWQGHIIMHARTSNDVSGQQAEWSADVLEMQDLFFRDEELVQVKAALLRIFLEHVAGSAAQ
jgi:hypothetical protein